VGIRYKNKFLQEKAVEATKQNKKASDTLMLDPG
jgi:hypothetical protein